jgi:hypothetical protein
VLLTAFPVLGGMTSVQGAEQQPEHVGKSCTQTSGDAHLSCLFNSNSDFWLALAKCANLLTADEQWACQQTAREDKKSGDQDCQAQFAARQAICAQLGEAPYHPLSDPKNFTTTIDNPYFTLTPGTTLIYEGQTAAGLEHEEFAVTHRTRKILGVRCVEVHDTSTVKGKLTEDTLDWFAQDKAGNVWYFGENSKQVAGGLVVGLEGSWIAGEDGAQPGIIMEAHPAVGDVYRQEFALGTAEDLAEVVSLNKSVTVPAGSFTHCLETQETTPLEPDALENKFYCCIKQTGNKCDFGANVLTKDITANESLLLVNIITGP